MDSFNDEDRPRLQLQFPSVEFAESCNEIIFRNINGLAIEKLHHIALQISVVHSLEVVKVELSVRESRSVKTVDELVISRKGYGTDTAGLELYAQPLAECRLAA